MSVRTRPWTPEETAAHLTFLHEMAVKCACVADFVVTQKRKTDPLWGSAWLAHTVIYENECKTALMDYKAKEQK